MKRKIFIIILFSIIILFLLGLIHKIFATNIEIDTKTINIKPKSVKIEFPDTRSYIKEITVPGDRTSKYYIHLNTQTKIYRIYKYDVINKTHIMIHDLNEDIADFSDLRYVNCVTRGNVIYVAYYKDANTSTILGYDVKQNKTTYPAKNFNVNLQYQNNGFAVDDYQNFYFRTGESGGKTFRSYDKNANLLSTYVYTGSEQSTGLKDVLAGNKLLGASMGNQSYFIIDNGKIKELKKLDTHLVTSSWYFFDNNKFAVNACGEFVEWDFTNYTYNLLFSIDFKSGYYANEIHAIQKGNYVYIKDREQGFYKYDINKKKVVAYANLTNGNSGDDKNDKVIVDGLYNVNNKLYMTYWDYEYNNQYVVECNWDSELAKSKEYVHFSNTASTHTIKQITDKYNASIPTKTTTIESHYKIAPSINSPYKAGKLSNDAQKETLNKINYYRWLYGISNVSINENYMDNCQKGAVLMAHSKTVAHYLSQPDDMDDSFYKAALTGIGGIYRASCAGRLDNARKY